MTELIFKSGVLLIDKQIWDKFLDLLSYGGFVGSGTIYPANLEWDGSYLSCNLGQRVTVSDAKAMGQALENLLLDIPETVNENKKYLPVDGDKFSKGINPIIAMALNHFAKITGQNIQAWERDYSQEPLTFFGGSDIPMLRKIIELCNEGGFEIW